MFLCQTGSWKKRGNKRVKLAGLDDKRQITAVFAATMNWRILATAAGLQRHNLCMPADFMFPDSWHITFTANL